MTDQPLQEAVARKMYARQTSVLIAGPFEDQSASRQGELLADAADAISTILKWMEETTPRMAVLKAGRGGWATSDPDQAAANTFKAMVSAMRKGMEG